MQSSLVGRVKKSEFTRRVIDDLLERLAQVAEQLHSWSERIGLWLPPIVPAPEDTSDVFTAC